MRLLGRFSETLGRPATKLCRLLGRLPPALEEGRSNADGGRSEVTDGGLGMPIDNRFDASEGGRGMPVDNRLLI